ncbi:hypothetical protein HYPBUDRAFT_140008 [Hyphopichia burtonii NRRL Y-1933]|uniref:Elongation of fatty acids protein n=1 Tax=Hyphopichia burtonii NRRL Y-1933 TaxID=984485 RepID=A0A1E4RJ19_9ASCO|nr:hypothetical protein HYPBUDRAFT_140008 [Hyphopichia burtonii NRRL Y-1933]ODV67272.1 hypothetical protein HYPBUDRAFT_140008 [Hyphopichia burtonii NRRL Y-1933]
MTVSLGLPHPHLFKLPQGDIATPQSPFESEILSYVFDKSMNVSTPLSIAIVYFSFVHFINPCIRQRQMNLYNQTVKDKSLMMNDYNTLTKQQRRLLRAAPFKIATFTIFKIFVLIHNVFLCLYSVWTFIGMTRTISLTMKLLNDQGLTENYSLVGKFFTSVCDLNHGVFNENLPYTNLTVFGWFFYISKFYEVLDTIIILLKGKPSSLLQSYHHAGAMMCMWAGIRFQSPPIWIFVVFNSFIHSLMYFYFSLSCLQIRVANICKRILTSMQISQFIIGGSLAVVHAFIWFKDLNTNQSCNCIGTSDQALPLIINVSYLTPLTALFAAFYIESYIKNNKSKSKSN